jgi:hypothetical protein
MPEVITVGDRVEALITVSGAETAAPRFPSWAGTWGRAEVLEAGGPEPAGAGVWRQRLVLTGFAPGRLELPPVEVAVPGGQETIRVTTPQGLAIEVRSVLPAGEQDIEPKPPEGLRGLPIGERFWWAAGIGLALLAAAIFLYARRSAAGEAAEAKPRLAPLPELLSELDALAGDPAVKAHTRLSHAFRRYLGRTAGFAALERTTTEIHRLLTRQRLSPAVVRRLVELLRACDLVKFARQEVSGERTAERLAAARELALAVESELHPPEPQGATAGAAAPREAA